MPRTARVAPNQHVYHVLTRGNNRQNVFKEQGDYKKYYDILKHYKEKFEFRLYHYVLMINHVHLVLEPMENGGRLSEIMKGINISYAQYYKNKYEISGHFWQDRFKSMIISKDSYLLACGSYVELNPVRAKIVKDPKDYKWSSYGVYAFSREDEIVDRHPIYLDLARDEVERTRKYIDFINKMLHLRNAMKGEMDMKNVYGGDEFSRYLYENFKLDSAIRPRGRPAKTASGEK